MSVANKIRSSRFETRKNYYAFFNKNGDTKFSYYEATIELFLRLLSYFMTSNSWGSGRCHHPITPII